MSNGDGLNAWRGMRRLRSAALGLATAEPERRTVFRAAIEQAEALAVAAAAGGYAVCPLPLYYAMSQAGRAMVAAWHREPDWNSIRTHGLSVPQDLAASVSETHVQPYSSGMFVAV